MKTTATKGPSKAAKNEAVRDLDVKPGKGGTVRGGPTAVEFKFGPSASAVITSLGATKIQKV